MNIASTLLCADSKLAYMKTLADRVIEAREDAGIEKPAALAKIIGVSPSAIYQIEIGKTKSLNPETLFKLSEALNVSAEWLRTGIGAKKLDPATGVVIPLWQAEAAAGHGVNNGNAEQIGGLSFRAHSLNKKNICKSTAHILYVRGDSMKPRLNNGDAILFDTSQTEIKEGKVYVIQWGDETLVKRLFKELNGSIRVVSDNSADPSFRDRIVKPGTQEFRILGRVRWIGSWED